MSYVITAVVFILIFSVLILIHELGHFVMAKRAGIKVEEFGFGLPPRMWGKKKGETVYSINWIPFGGFVRMLGEDAGDPKMLTSKRSFIAQPMRARVLVIIAGVVMNFFLAWFLMFVGFTFGMEPLLVEDDVFGAVADGVVVLDEGVRIKSVDDGSLAEEIGFKSEDVIYLVDGKEISYDFFNFVGSDPIHEYKIIRGAELLTFEPVAELLDTFSSDNGLGVELYPYLAFPRVKLFDVGVDSDSYRYGLRAADIILTINGEQVFYVPQYEEITRGRGTLEYEVYRNGLVEKVIVEQDPSRRIIVSNVLPDSPAMAAGLQDADVIVSVNGKEITDVEEMIAFVEEHDAEDLAFIIERNGEKILYEIKPENSKIGVLLSELMSYGVDRGITVYNVDQMSSILEIKDEKYPVYISAYKAIGETWRLSKMTAKMFVSFVSNFIRNGDVPSDVSGPVGIAQLTHLFVQEGFIPLIRFVAILSLSLAVVNILPFPALDGGRLFFIFVEFLIGRKVNQKWEAMIHAIGFLLLILLIIVITYSDIVKLIGV